MKKKLSALLAILLVYAMMAPMTMATISNAELDEDGYAVLGAETRSVVQATVGKGTLIDPSLSAVWRIKFPTADSVSFLMDPQRVAYLSEMEEGINSSDILLFTQYDEEGDVVGMASTTSEVAVVNEGTVDVNVDLNVRPTATTMKYDTTPTGILSSETKASVGFFVGTSSSSVSTAIPIVGYNSSATLKANLSLFEPDIDEDETGKLIVDWGEGEEGDTAAEKFARASFFFKGQTNPDTDKNVIWAGETAPNLQLTWTVRSTQVEAVKITPDALKGSVTGIAAVAADRAYALAGDTITVYVQPATHSDADKHYEIQHDTNAAKAKMSLKDHYVNFDKITDDKEIALSDPVPVENGLYALSFTVPGKGGSTGFSGTKADGTTPNVITFSGALKAAVVTTSTTAAS